MIGGYLYDNENEALRARLNQALDTQSGPMIPRPATHGPIAPDRVSSRPMPYQRIELPGSGLLFHDDPFSDLRTALVRSDRLTALSQDLLVIGDSNGQYSLLDVHHNLPRLLSQNIPATFQEIVSDFRMIVIEKSGNETALYLVSNRGGNGRMYYHLLESGILFSSDIRFLLKIIPLEVNDLGVYALLKYGAIPEPLTISDHIAAVPPAHYLRYHLPDGVCRTRAYFQFDFSCDIQEEPTADLEALLQTPKRMLQGSAHYLRQYRPAILISGGIDSSLYACYLNEGQDGCLDGIHCTFGQDDPEFPYAQALAQSIGAHLHVGRMNKEDALPVLDDTVALTGHPFSDFSSLPIVFTLKFIKDHLPEADMLIECNGGDDCFGFPDLGSRSKMLFKSRFPGAGKQLLASLLRNAGSWKWESHQGSLSRLSALADVHERVLENYFLVLTPVNFLRLNAPGDWDRRLTDIMEDVFSSYAPGNDHMSYEAKVTIRQLMHINSRRWAAKAFSVSENLGIRCIYPYIWRDILIAQGRLPWKAKIKDGVVKWPLKRLLEKFMPTDFIYRPKSGFVPPFARWLTFRDFNDAVRQILLSTHTTIETIVPSGIIDELLTGALGGNRPRHALLNFLWGALFTEMWIQRYQ
jgi:asparagine synthase (glutamine-hydrolysing)